MPLAVTNYNFSVFLHVTAVVVGFGSTFSESVMFPVAMRASARNLPYVHRLQLVLNQFFALPAVVIVAATGIYQMDKGGWDYGDFWVGATITILAVIALINVFFFIRPTGSSCRSSRRRSRTRAVESSSSPTCPRPTSAWVGPRASSDRSPGSC